AASVLRTAGFGDVSDVVGGFGAWQNAGLPSSRGDEGDSIGEAPHVGARTAQTMLDRGALLLDVREPDEWYAQHAPAAMFVPMGRVRARQNELPRHRAIVVCAAPGGGRRRSRRRFASRASTP